MEIFYIAILTFAASIVGTMTGFGSSTIMIPILIVFLPPVETIFLVAIIHWFGEIWKIVLFRQGLNLKLIISFSIIGLLASYFGASISVDFDEKILLSLLGGFLTAYAIFLLIKLKFKVKAGAVTALTGGALSGFFSGMFGMGGTIRGAFLSAFNLPKAVYIATSGAIGMICDVARIITYWENDVTLPNRLWYGLIVFILVSFFGAKFAKKIINKIPQGKFRIVIAVFLLLIGIKLLVYPT